MEEFNFNEHNTKEVNLSEFDALCRDIFDKRKEIEAMEEETKKHVAELEKLKTKAMLILKDARKEKFFVEGKGTVYIQDRYTVSMPKEPEKREEFFRYLKENGIFESLATVNHQTLNAYWKQEWEAAGKNPDFTLPGVGCPTLFQTLAMKKA